MAQNVPVASEQTANIKPRMSLTVGVTGHREQRLLGVDRAALSKNVTEVLLRLQQSTEAMLREHPEAFSDRHRYCA